MNKTVRYSILSLLLLCCSLLTAAIEKKEWTFLVYLAGANSLSDFAYADLAEMMKVGSNDKVNVIVYFTAYESNGAKTTKRLYVLKDSILQVSPTTVEDSGSIETLKRAIEWMIAQYPADNYYIGLWNHGGGILNKARSPLRGVCYDDETGSFLTDRDCLEGITYAKALNDGKNIGIVAVDACLMNMLEFAFTISSCSDFLVASEETIPGDGFDYERVLTPLAQGLVAPRTFAQHIVQAYSATYAGTSDYTLAALDQARIAPIITNLHQIAAILTEGLRGSQKATVRKYIKMSLSGIPAFSDGSYVDLLSFYKKLAYYATRLGLAKDKITKLQQLLMQGEGYINAAVIAKALSANYKNAGGISLYFPSQSIDSSYANLYWTEHNPFMLQLLKQYITPSSFFSFLN